ncbi:MAG: hypothetical protein JKY13_03425 [Gammaproteobacteria bacterium]|nr:hypothetical protein [Gammaproteobacteria bacterium]
MGQPSTRSITILELAIEYDLQRLDLAHAKSRIQQLALGLSRYPPLLAHPLA